MATWTKETINLNISSASLTVDNIKIDGTTIGHTDDTDLLTLTNGSLAIAGTVTGVTTLAASGNVTVGGTLVSTGTITGTLATAAQTNITSLGTLTALQVDNINLNTNTINATSGDLTITAAGGDISFGDENLTTTGWMGIGIASRTSSGMGGSGITVNVGDVYTRDGSDFAQRLADELPRALRLSTYKGGF